MDMRTVEQSEIQSATSSITSTTEKTRFVIDRMQIMFGCYRAIAVSDPDAYVAAIAAVLVDYDPDIIRAATDPCVGIAASEKFKRYAPNAGELKDFCEQAKKHKKTLSDLRDIFQKRGCVIVLHSSPNYESMKRRAGLFPRDAFVDGDSRGVWVPKEWLDAAP